MRHSIKALLLTLLLLSNALAQNLGTEFTFQGSLRDANVAAQGNHDFEFTLHNNLTTGAPLTPALSRPSVAVADGIFTTKLDFGGQFFGQKRWIEIKVRRVGQPTFTTLVPRMEVSPTPYSQHADMVAANSIISANILDRTIIAADISFGTITSTELADGSVTNPKIADGAVTFSKLGALSVNASKVDSSQIQLRVSGRCSRGRPMLGVAGNGGVICDQPMRVGASNSFTYERVSVAIRSDGRPLVAYDGPTLMDCNDVDCNSWTTRSLPGAFSGDGVSLAIRSDGLPVIAYGSSSGLFLFVCSTSSCTTGDVRALDTSSSAVVFTTMALGAGNTPRVAYYHWGNGRTQLFACNTAACDSGGVIRNLPTGVTPRTLRIRNTGVPIVGLRDFNNSQSSLYDCNDATCSSGSVRLLGSVSPLRHTISIAVRADNRPVVANYHQDFNLVLPSNLASHDCADASCTSNTRTLNDTNAIVYGSDIAVRGLGNPVIAYVTGGADASLRLFDCSNSNCGAGTIRVLDTFTLGSDQDVSMALRPDGRPVIAYGTRSPAELRLLLCATTTCQ